MIIYNNLIHVQEVAANLAFTMGVQYNIQYTLYNIHHTLYIIHYKKYIYTLYIIHVIQYTMT